MRLTGGQVHTARSLGGYMEHWCSGNTADFHSAIAGSNPVCSSRGAYACHESPLSFNSADSRERPLSGFKPWPENMGLYLSRLERAAHNRVVVGSNPTRPTTANQAGIFFHHSIRKEKTMVPPLIHRYLVPKAPKYHGMAARIFASTSHRRLERILWYTSGFQ